MIKACLKRIVYKGMQGGRIDTVETIFSTLHGEQRMVTTWLNISSQREEPLFVPADPSPFIENFSEDSKPVEKNLDDYHSVPIFTPVEQLSNEDQARVIMRRLTDAIARVNLVK